jgi:competence protein ComEC
MKRNLSLIAIFGLSLVFTMVGAAETKNLEVYLIDVEGGQATLFVSPSGESMEVDTGWPGARDADRIASVAKLAGVSRIDYLVLTHYHGDHAGGVVDLASKIPIGTFIDHGPNVEQTLNSPKNYSAYVSVRGNAKHIVAKPGEKLPIAGLDVQVVSAGAETIVKPLAGAGAANPLCSAFQPKDETKDPLVGGENKQSVGMVISLGKFRMVDFGDLTWNKEHDLACPNNLIGRVDVYLVSHHGQDISSLPMLVHAMHPRVAVMDNGAQKGAAVPTVETLKSSPGLQDLWQLHYAEGATEHNMADQFIANLGRGGTSATGVPDEGTTYYIKVSARPDGSFTVMNSRNQFEKGYDPRGN